MTKSLLTSIEESVKVSITEDILNHSNPMPDLVERGLAVATGNGLFVLKGPLAIILAKIEKTFEAMARQFQAEEVHVPTMLAEDNVDRSEYLHSFSNQAQFLRLNGEAKGNGKILGLACPTVCYHYFSALKGTQVTSNHLVSALGRCSRFEEGTLTDLSRLWNFTMREIIGFGSASYCQTKLQQIEARSLEIFQDSFGLSFNLSTASDPFFGKNQEIKRKAQLLEASKFELRAVLPYNQSTISVASFNRHRGVFYDRFQIQKGEEGMESFCVGFGYERILYAILAQKGTDFTHPYYSSF